MIEPETLRRAVRAALEEDLGAGDLTSGAVLDAGARARGRIVAREDLVVAGLPVAREVFRQVDAALQFHEIGADGEARRPGDAVAEISGAARSILAGERTALNFLQRMSGIATATRRLARAVTGSGVEIADTRKTAPGLRAFDRYAVRIGGGTNHRGGLFDAVLIKDNHWRLVGGVGEAVRRARRALADAAPERRRVAIEVGSLDELRQALESGAEAILLDNMDPRTLAAAVAEARGRAFLEVSGGVREDDVPRIAALGVNRISLGALTHSVRAADLALEVEKA
jgi:nicotinate-nucleotide pyrophosphorylase (carboxylating)